MQIPKWLDNLLGDDDENDFISNDPVTNTEKIPKTPSPPRKKKTSATGLAAYLSKQSPINIAAIGLLFVLLVCAIIFPKGQKNQDSRGSYTAAFSDPVAIGSAEFSLISVDWDNDYVGDTRNQITTAPGNTFYSVFVQVRNIGKNTISLVQNDSWQKSPYFSYSLIYDDGYEYFSSVQDGNSEILENFMSTIIPLQSTSKYVVFEVPQSVAEGNGPLAFRVYSANSIVTWTIRP